MISCTIFQTNFVPNKNGLNFILPELRKCPIIITRILLTNFEKKNMKKPLIPIVLLFTMFVITGCPVGVPYSLGKQGTEKINKDMLGTWTQTNADQEVMKMEIVKRNNNSVQVNVIEKGSMYSIESDKFYGWFTEIDGKNFIYLQDINDATDDYYTYCYEFDGNTMKSYDISLKVGGVDAITSTEAYRAEVSASLKFEDALSSETIWTKQ